MFARLLHGCDTGDILTLAAWQAYGSLVKQYIPSEKRLVDTDRIPWPVKWLFIRRHRKHIFRSNTLPNMGTITHQVNNFVNKMKWRWALRHNHRATSVAVPRDRRTPACNVVCDASLNFLLDQFRNGMCQTALATRRSLQHCKRDWSNVSGLEKLALRLLADGEFAAVPNDKNSRFSMVLRAEMPRITDSILSSSVYLRGSCNDNVITDIVRRYRLCRLVGAAAEDEALGPLLSKTTRRRNSHAVSVLQLTVKDHKLDGEVTCRPIHATPNFMFAGLSAWLRAVPYWQRNWTRLRRS